MSLASVCAQSADRKLFFENSACVAAVVGLLPYLYGMYDKSSSYLYVMYGNFVYDLYVLYDNVGARICSKSHLNPCGSLGYS